MPCVIVNLELSSVSYNVNKEIEKNIENATAATETFVQWI